MRRGSSFDKPMFFLVAAVLIGGALIFASAAFGLLARGATHMSTVAFNHIVLGIGIGLIALFVCFALDHRVWRHFALHIYVLALILTAAVLLPAIGVEHGGGRRWLIIFGMSFQPSEVLKIASIILAAMYFTLIRTKISTYTYGLGGFIGILLAPAVLLVLQPDLGTLGIVCISVLAVFVAAGAPMRHIIAA